MDVDCEDAGLDMEGEMIEESMATDIQESGPFVGNSEAPSVAMATENGDMLELEAEFDNNGGSDEMNAISETTNSHLNGLANSNNQSYLPGPGVITNFRTFSKIILSPGFGNSVPKDGTLCNVNIFILNLNSVRPEDIGYETGDNVVIMVGEGDAPIARRLDLCLQTMKQGEICDIEIPLNLLSNESNVCSSTPACSFRVHLVSFQDSVSSWQLLPGEKITRAAHHKEKGTALFQQGKTEFAFQRFSKALKYLICCHPQDSIPENLQETYLKLRCQCYSNMAACQMKLNQYTEVVENCSKALDIDPQNVKALYRRGQAYFFFGDIDLAKSDLDMVATLEPQNKAVVQLLSQLEAKQKQGDVQLAAGLSKMFS